MRVLGALLAGGRSSRFGSDKALAVIDGEPLVARVAAALAGQVDAIVVCGREDRRWHCLSDVPEPGLGPMGGLAAALRYAAREGFGAVLSAPCDLAEMPDLRGLLGAPDAFASRLPVAGMWSPRHADAAEDFARCDATRSMRGWAARIGARAVEIGSLANINTPADLAAFSGQGTRP